MLCFALIDEPEPFFLDMPVNVSIAVFKRHGFTTSGTCKQNQNLLKTDMLCFALIDEPEPFFLDMPVNVSIAVFKRHGFTTSGTCKQICR